MEETFNPNDMYHMFDLRMLDDNIWYFRNSLSYPKELLEFINELDANSSTHQVITKWSDWTASNDSSFVYGKSKDILVANIGLKSDSVRTDQKILYVKNSFEMAARMCLDTYISSRRLNRDSYDLSINHIPLRKWNAGTDMGPHCDNYDGDTNIAFSMITYINEDYSGGEIEFPNQGITLKPEAGSVVIFPSTEPYLHKVNKIISGERYTSHLSVYKK